MAPFGCFVCIFSQPIFGQKSVPGGGVGEGDQHSRSERFGTCRRLCLQRISGETSRKDSTELLKTTRQHVPEALLLTQTHSNTNTKHSNSSPMARSTPYLTHYSTTSSKLVSLPRRTLSAPPHSPHARATHCTLCTITTTTYD